MGAAPCASLFMKVAKSSSPLLLTITTGATGAVAARQGRRGFAEAGWRTQQSAGKRRVVGLTKADRRREFHKSIVAALRALWGRQHRGEAARASVVARRGGDGDLEARRARRRGERSGSPMAEEE